MTVVGENISIKMINFLSPPITQVFSGNQFKRKPSSISICSNIKVAWWDGIEKA